MLTVYAVQSFDEVEGCLVIGDRVQARSADGALRRAEGLNTFKTGAIAMQILTDDKSGKVEGVTVLGTFGSVPAEFVPLA
jgi:hypothetical protein